MALPDSFRRHLVIPYIESERKVNWQISVINTSLMTFCRRKFTVQAEQLTRNVIGIHPCLTYLRMFELEEPILFHVKLQPISSNLKAGPGHWYIAVDSLGPTLTFEFSLALRPLMPCIHHTACLHSYGPLSSLLWRWLLNLHEGFSLKSCCVSSHSPHQNILVVTRYYLVGDNQTTR